MPNHIENSKKVLKWIKEYLPEDICISVMNQYFPTYKAEKIEDINRKLTKREIKKIEDYLYSLSLQNGYIQDMEKDETKYVPNWKDVTIL